MRVTSKPRPMFWMLYIGWKLVQFFTVLNSGLLTIGFTLLGSNQITTKPAVASIFIIGILLSIISILARKSYHRHSLMASYKKTLIEKQLGLYNPVTVEGSDFKKHNYAISTSANFVPKSELFKNPEQYIKNNIFKKGTVPFYHVCISIGFIALDLIGIAISFTIK